LVNDSEILLGDRQRGEPQKDCVLNYRSEVR